MKKHILLFLALIMSMMATAQVTIQMEKEGGVYKVPCTVNGVKMKFIFDTGAATVSMSQTMAQFLLDGEYLSESDIKGTGKSVLADGSIVNHATIILKDVEIGGMHIHNIDATVIEDQNAPLLLGQSAISELGKISIEGDKLIIHSAENKLTRQQIDQLEEQANRYINSNSYAAAIDCLIRIDEAVGLTEYGLKNLCYCYSQNYQEEQCIESCRRWIKEYESIGDVVNKESVYEYLGCSYYYGRKDYNNALLYYQKSLDILENKLISKDNFYIRMAANRNWDIGSCYYGLNNYYSAITYYKKAINTRCEVLNVSMKDVQNGKVQDEGLGLFLYDYAFCYYQLKNDADGDEVMKLAAICGNQNAIDFCRKYNINYQTKSSKLFE